MERDGWIIWSVASPHEVNRWAHLKLQNLADPDVRATYMVFARAAAWSPDHPRLVDLAERWTAARQAAKSEIGEIDYQGLESHNPTTVALITDRFAATSPAFARLAELADLAEQQTAHPNRRKTLTVATGLTTMTAPDEHTGTLGRRHR